VIQAGFTISLQVQEKRLSLGLWVTQVQLPAFSYLAVGTSSTAVAITDTTLNAEITDTGLARASATVSRVTTTVTNDTLQLTYTWTASGVKSIQEIGILNAASTGILLSHALTGTITTAKRQSGCCHVPSKIRITWHLQEVTHMQQV